MGIPRSHNVTAHDLNNDMRMTVLPVTILIGMEALVGFFGNIFIIIVYSTKYPRCNFRYFVLSMAVVDLTSCLTTLPGEIFSQLNWYDFKHDWICKTKSFFNVFTAWASGLILACLAFDRYRKICRPLNWQISKSSVQKLLLGTLIVASLVSIPITILWGKQTYLYNHYGIKINVSICEKASQYKDTLSPFLYVTGVYIIPIGLMMVAACVLNFLTARKLFCKMETFNGTNESIEMESPQPQRQSRHHYMSNYRYGTMPNRTHHKPNTCVSIVSDQTGTISHAAVSAASVQCIRSLETNGNYVNMPSRSNQASGVACQQGNLERNVGEHTIRAVAGEDLQARQEWQADLQENGNVGDTHRDSNVRDKTSAVRMRRKTLIMLILTSVFVVTMVLYVVLLSVVSRSDNVLQELTDEGKVIFFLFWRLYFINCVINPILYGFMDSRFRNGLKRLLCCKGT